MDLNLKEKYEDYRIKEYEIMKKNTESGIKIIVVIVCVFEFVAMFLLCVGLLGCEIGADSGIFALILSIVIGGGILCIGMASVKEDIYDLRKLEENLGIERCKKKQKNENSKLL